MTFANPAALWLLLTVPPLLALYFLRVRRKRIRVPSVLLWSGVLRNERTAHPWDRFRRHLLLWLQLLFLLLLTLALAEPSVPGTRSLGASTVWVVDASASMAAAAPPPSRFERAREQLIGAIADLGPVDEGMILLAGPEPKVLVSFTRDKDALAAAARSMQPTSAAASLGGAVDLAVALARTRPDRGIVVLTDGSDPSLDLAVGRHPEVAVVWLGRSADNVAITAVDLRRSPTDDLQAELFVTLRRFGGHSDPVGITVWRGDELLARETVELEPGPGLPRVYQGLGAEGGVLRVRLETGDPLPLDDEAVAWLDPPAKRDVLCVGCTALTARALAADDRFLVRTSMGRSPTREPDVVVYEGVSVPADPPSPFFALGPPTVADHASGAAVAWPRVTDWSRTHPTLRFVEPAAFLVGEARPSAPRGFEPLLESDVGPLLSTGVTGGRRGVVLHFDPLKSDLPLRVGYPVLLLNTVAWLSGEELATGRRTLAAGSPLVREGWGDDGAEIVLQAPDGAERAVAIRAGTARFGALNQVGIHRLIGPEGRQERIAVNLVSDAESDLAARSPTPTNAAGEVVVRESVAGRRPIVRPLLLLAALLLCGEWWLWQRRFRE